MLLDALKGTAAVLLARQLGGEAPLAGLAAVLGHTLTPWLGFHGGKGVATGLGALYGIAWPLGLAACAVWLLTAAAARMSSLAAIITFAATPFLAILVHPYPWPVPFIAGWIIWRHNANIARLRAGTEPRIGRR